MVFDLGDLVDTRLLRDVFGRGRLRLENVRLNFDVSYFGLGLALFGQELSQVDLDACWWARPELIDRSRVLGLAELHQLRFDHFDLLLLALLLDALLLPLSRRQILSEYVQIVGVAAENSLIVHDVESRAAIAGFFRDRRVEHSIFGAAVPVSAVDNLRLSSFKGLGHFIQII